MIEKLSEYKITSRDGSFINVECNTKIINTLVRKINELVEFCNDIGNARFFLERHEEQITKLNSAVNEMQKNYDNVCIWVGEQKLNYNPDTTKGLSTLVEAPADPYAEQRKWIGKLCRFKDEDYKDDQWDYGLLQAVVNAETAHIWKAGCFKHNHGHWYDYCEPVKPDDSIIYKG